MTDLPPILETWRKVYAVHAVNLWAALNTDPTTGDADVAITRMHGVLDQIQAAIRTERDKTHVDAAEPALGHWLNPATGTVYSVDIGWPGDEVLSAYRWQPDAKDWVRVDPAQASPDVCRRLTGDELRQWFAHLGIGV